MESAIFWLLAVYLVGVQAWLPAPGGISVRAVATGLPRHSLLLHSSTADAATSDERTATEIQRLFSEAFGSSAISASPELGADLGMALSAANELGRNRLSSLRIPHGKDEAWRHTSIRKLFGLPYSRSVQGDQSEELAKTVGKYVDEACQGSCLVFVDGVFSSVLSQLDNIPDGLVLGGLKFLTAEQRQELQALSSDGFLQRMAHVPDVNEAPRDSFGSEALTLLNLANLADVAVVAVRPNEHVHKPVQVIFCSSAGNEATASVSFPRLIVQIGDGASLRLKQSFINEPVTDPASYGALVNCNTQVSLGRGTTLEHTYLQELDEQFRHCEVLTASIQGNSSYEASVIQAGDTVVGRVNVHIDLKESSANCTLNGVTLAGKRQCLDLHSSIVHDAPAANSVQQQRNIIGDNGQAVFKGRIRVPKHAQLTDSDQLCKSLMLGEKARVVAMPTLEITADNVVCSHGAAIADLDENSMFYLAARGIDRREARNLLLRSFALETVTNTVMDKATVDRLIAKLDTLNPVQGKDTFELNRSSQKLVSI